MADRTLAPASTAFASDSEEDNESVGSSLVNEAPLDIPPMLKTTPQSTNTFCCATDKAIQEFVALCRNNPQNEFSELVHIVDSQKQTDMSGSSFYSYSIQARSQQDDVLLDSKHRYSEFESLQKLLRVLYPYVVVPPIPEKHSLADYASKQGKAKDDLKMIEKRKRMLQRFLNRVAKHPILGREHLYHRFLSEGNWSEALSSSGYAVLLRQKKNPVQKLAEKQKSKHADPHFHAAEEYTEKFSSHMNHTHGVNKKVVKHYVDLAGAHADLGHVYNSFSLSEPNMGPLIEKVGAAYDEITKATTALVSHIERDVSEPLQEYAQFSKIVEKVLRNRLRKQLDLHNVTESLESKKVYLASLEKSEAEEQRLAAVLNAEGASALPRSTGGTGSNGIISTLNSYFDNDPAATRRQNISKTKARIIELTEEKAKKEVALKEMNEGVQKDLNRFQREKIRDVKHMLIEYAKAHREYCQKAIGIWKEVRDDLM